MSMQRPPRAAVYRTTPRLTPWLAIAAGLGFACADAAPSSIEPGEELPGGETTNDLLFGENAFTPPVKNATLENERAFFAGNAFFNQAWTESPSSTTARDGLGPLFNARACSTCHFKDGRGRPPIDADEGFTSMLLRLSVPGATATGEPRPEPVYGGQLQPFGVTGVPGEGVPRVSYRLLEGRYADGTPYELLEPTYSVEAPAHGPLDGRALISPRVAPAMIGLGLLEAIPEETLLGLADPDDADGDGISGRVNEVWDATTGGVTIGRFGWKSEQPTVWQQSAGAFVGDMGVTSTMFPAFECSDSQPECKAARNGGEPEIPDTIMQRVTRYSQLVAVPARLRYAEPAVLEGKALFSEIGCASCHVASHVTSDAAELPELRSQRIWPYTDLLLHDMGEGLSDHRPSFGASGAEWRTPPLWGLGYYPVVNGHDRLLHDGRARGVAEAILWHGGEAEAARQAFVELSASERQTLVEFVESL